MILEDIKRVLENNGLTNIFIGRMPPSPDNCIALFSYLGRLPELKHNYDRPSFQVQTRGIDYQDAEQRANTVFSLLHALSTTYINEVWVVDMHAHHSPYHLLSDDKDRFVFAQSYSAEIEHNTQNRV